MRNLPTLFFFTDRNRFTDIFYTIENLPKNTAIIIREYDLEYKDRLEFAKRVVTIAKANNLITFLGKSLRMSLEAKTNGVHFSDRDKSWRNYLMYQKLNPNFLLSCSCHSEKAIRKAHNFKIKTIFYSPIFKTDSHPNDKTIGHNRLAKMISNRNYQIYALGGINNNNISLLRNLKMKGIGAISLLI